MNFWLHRCYLGLSLLGGFAVDIQADRYVVVDRIPKRNLMQVSSQGVVTPITAAVPWELASAVALDAAGNYIVAVDMFTAAGNDNDGVYRISPAGNIVPISVGPPFHDPMGLAIDAAGNYILVSYSRQTALASTRRIIQVTPAGQTAVIHEGRPLRYPTAIAIDANGEYVITDRGSGGRLFGVWAEQENNGAVYRFNPVTKQWTTVRSSVDANDNIKMNDLLGHLAGIAIDTAGNYVITVPSAYIHINRVDYSAPIGISEIMRMRPNGEILQRIPIPILNDRVPLALGIAIDREGNYIIADAVGLVNTDGRILRITPNGQLTILCRTTDLGWPQSIAIVHEPTGPHRVGTAR